MSFADPEKRRAASRDSQRRRRSGANGAGGRVDAPKNPSAPAAGSLDPAEVLARLALELDRLDAEPKLDAAVRARTVARVCAVALMACKQLEAPDDPPVWWDTGQLTARQLATLQRLLSKIEVRDG
jgi:hypothetical protein